MPEKGQVIKSAGGITLVKPGKGDPVECTLSGRYRLEGLRSTNPVVVGDYVHFEHTPGSGRGRIIDVLKRKNYIIRKASKLSKTYQIIASNIDQLLLVVSVSQPVTYPEFIDRYLVTAEAYNIPSRIVFNKIDLYQKSDKEKLEYLTGIYRAIGYPCLEVSAVTKENLPQLRALMKDHISLLSGISGVGKSTLVNQLDENINLKTAPISGAHRSGKHTTTFVEMFPLSFGGYVIDTPGIKGFGIVDMENEPISHYFPEIFLTGRRCKFHNCQHINEPGCAVSDALQKGNISQSRYRSYLSLLDEQNEQLKYR